MEQSVTKEHARAMYNLGCIEYLRLFCEKHGFDYEDAKDSWVGNEIGGITCVSDYFVDMGVIIADIEMDAPEHEFMEWYDYCLDANEFGLVEPNFKSWIKGCPRTSEETMGHLRKLKQDLNDCIKKEKENNLF
jgi:hypothetical protein